MQHFAGHQSRNDYYRNESRQSNYNDRYGAGGATTNVNDRPYTPKLSSPAPPPPPTVVVNPANTNGYHRNEVSSRVQDRNGYRHESRREEYRSESRNGVYQPRSSSVVGREPLDNWRSESRAREADRDRNDYRTDSRNDYRVDSPASNNGTLHRRTGAEEAQNRSESRAESVRSVRILRKTFE